MTDSFLPELREGYRWQLTAEGGWDCTGEYYAETDAVEARIWHEDVPVLVLTRTGDWDYWGSDGIDGTGGLRTWAIQGPAPEGLMDWEQFVTLSQIPHRIHLGA